MKTKRDMDTRKAWFRGEYYWYLIYLAWNVVPAELVDLKTNLEAIF